MEVFQAIRTNRSVRQFVNRAVSRDDIERILHAGRLSGSAKNSQPWQFIVVTEPETLGGLSKCGPWCGHLAGAAFAVVLTSDDLRDPPTLSRPFDLGRAAQNMILAAWELGIGSCMATIYEMDLARSLLGIPAERAVPWAISFGYPAPEADPRNRAPRATGRKSLDEVVRWEKWE